MDRPQHPAGALSIPDQLPDAAKREALIAEIAEFPEKLRTLVASLSEDLLQRKYVNWSVRQIVNHLADSHVHGLIRIKLALTRMHPTIAPYDETATAELVDSTSGSLDPALAMLEGVHARMVRLFRNMSEADFSLAFFHPERNASVTLWELLVYCTWHGKHHMAQIALLLNDVES